MAVEWVWLFEIWVIETRRVWVTLLEIVNKEERKSCLEMRISLLCSCIPLDYLYVVLLSKRFLKYNKYVFIVEIMERTTGFLLLKNRRLLYRV